MRHSTECLVLEALIQAWTRDTGFSSSSAGPQAEKLRGELDAMAAAKAVQEDLKAAVEASLVRVCQATGRMNHVCHLDIRCSTAWELCLFRNCGPPFVA